MPSRKENLRELRTPSPPLQEAKASDGPSPPPPPPAPRPSMIQPLDPDMIRHLSMPNFSMFDTRRRRRGASGLEPSGQDDARYHPAMRLDEHQESDDARQYPNRRLDEHGDTGQRVASSRAGHFGSGAEDSSTGGPGTDTSSGFQVAAQVQPSVQNHRDSSPDTDSEKERDQT